MENIDIDSQHEINVAQQIAARQFGCINHGESVLELGPQTGGFFTREILKHTNLVSCIEYNDDACRSLRQEFGSKINLIIDDFHSAVRTCGEFDVVILYGVLYHSPAPLGLLEDIANYVNPKKILLETWNLFRPVEIFDEPINISGHRQTNKKQCGISLTLGQPLLSKALVNLGYVQQDTTIKATDMPEVVELFNQYPGSIFKRDGVYSTWKINI